MKALPYKNQGFTMIELIVVIIMLTIMAISVVPKFFNSSGFQEYTYEDDVITTLRAIQVRAMQQTNGGGCHLVLITEDGIGIPEDCPNITGGWLSDTTSVVIESGHDVGFDLSSGIVSFTFDGMGRPSCGGCSITIVGESTLTVTIESEGYIHGS